MAGFSDYIENFVLDAVFNDDAASFPSIPNIYIKLHLGDPGENGTANAAAETTREQVTFGVASGGQVVSSAAVTWTNVAATETITHISLWDDPTAGNALGTAALNISAPLTAGDDLTLTTVTFTLD
jgi:hypothetical protein